MGWKEENNFAEIVYLCYIKMYAELYKELNQNKNMITMRAHTYLLKNFKYIYHKPYFDGYMKNIFPYFFSLYMAAKYIQNIIRYKIIQRVFKHYFHMNSF